MRTFTIKETTQKTSEIFAEMKALFSVWSYYNDAQLDKDFPPPKKITTREFLYSIEPDPATLGKSAKEGDPQQTGITLRERMLMEIQYFKKTGNHLDIKGWTICSGSRRSDGYVPFMCFYPFTGKVRVDWYYVDYSLPGGGLRQAVLPSSTFNSNPSYDLENAITNAMLEEIYIKADKISKENSQSAPFPMGEGKFYYITVAERYDLDFYKKRIASHLSALKEELMGKKCRRCSMPISECSKKRWEKPLCVVNGTEWDEHVIGLSDIFSPTPTNEIK